MSFDVVEEDKLKSKKDRRNCRWGFNCICCGCQRVEQRTEFRRSWPVCHYVQHRRTKLENITIGDIKRY